MARVRLGIRLIENGIITQEQLDEAMAFQQAEKNKGNNLKLGEILINKNLCTDEDVAIAMSENTGFDYMSLDQTSLNSEAVSLLTPEECKKYYVMPIDFEKDKLLLAMHNPNNIMAIDDIKMITGYDIKPIIVSNEEIKAVIEQYANMIAPNESEEEDEEYDFVESNAEASDTPAVILTTRIINSAIRANASDIHIEPQEKY